MFVKSAVYWEYVEIVSSHVCDEHALELASFKQLRKIDPMLEGIEIRRRIIRMLPKPCG